MTKNLLKSIVDGFIITTTTKYYAYWRSQIMTAFSGIMDVPPMKIDLYNVQHILFGHLCLILNKIGIKEVEIVPELTVDKCMIKKRLNNRFHSTKIMSRLS